MARSLKIRKPRRAEIRRLEALLAETDHPFIQRRAQAILFYGAGLTAVDIAAALQVDPRTIYRDLQAFGQAGLACLQPPASGGALPRLQAEQVAALWRLAETPPLELGLPYGRWTLGKLRAYVRQARLIKEISREHLRRLLKKGGCIFGGSSARLSAMIPSGSPF
jgi:transposase